MSLDTALARVVGNVLRKTAAEITVEQMAQGTYDPVRGTAGEQWVSSDFDTWTAYGTLTFTTGVADPDGGTSAMKIAAGYNGAYKVYTTITVTGNSTKSFTVDVAQSTGTYCGFEVTVGASNYAAAELTWATTVAATIYASVGTVTLIGPTSLGDGWYRYGFTIATTTGTLDAAVIIYMNGYTLPRAQSAHYYYRFKYWEPDYTADTTTVTTCYAAVATYTAMELLTGTAKGDFQFLVSGDALASAPDVNDMVVFGSTRYRIVQVDTATAQGGAIVWTLHVKGA